MNGKRVRRRKLRACARTRVHVPTKPHDISGVDWRPARGSGWGGPANGDGWGGSPRGAGRGNPGQRFLASPGPGRGHFTIAGEQRAEREEIRREAIMQLYYEIAHNPDASPMLRINAATKLLDRIEGLPMRRFVTVTDDPISLLSDQQLQAEIDRLKRKLA